MFKYRKDMPSLSPSERKTIADGWRMARALGIVRTAAERHELKCAAERRDA